MTTTKDKFIELALACNVLQWGEFTLKSGRVSPYFFNAGLFYHNHALRQLGQFYAALILENHLNVQHLFGPAYKGLPLATATAIALDTHGLSVTVTFNRKESKDHGEGGMLIGAPLNTGNTVIIDDVITAGTAFRESKQLIEQQKGRILAVCIALDRCERGIGNQSTLQEIKAQGIDVYSIITLFDLIAYLERNNQLERRDRLQEYHARYGS